MAALKDVMFYLMKNYPSNMAEELSNARLTKMVYLADWHRAINSGEQITNIDWYFDNYGPFVHDISRAADREKRLFDTDSANNLYGATKKVFHLRDRDYIPTLSALEKRSLDHIIDVTSKLYWNDFIKLVYATHPVASSERYSHLDLVEKAGEYKAIKARRKAREDRKGGH